MEKEVPKFDLSMNVEDQGDRFHLTHLCINPYAFKSAEYTGAILAHVAVAILESIRLELNAPGSEMVNNMNFLVREFNRTIELSKDKALPVPIRSPDSGE